MTVSTVAVCCDDLGLMSDARRVCAAAGLEAEITGEGDMTRWWPSATAVLIDRVAASRVASHGLARRDRVALLTRAAEADDWRLAVTIGAEQVVVLPTDERALVEGGVLGGRDRGGGARVVACLPATGGAGASTAAAALALATARRGASTLLVDADPAGGGLDLLFGLERTVGVRWPDLTGPAAVWPPDALPDGLLGPSANLRLLSWDRPGDARPDAPVAWPLLLPSARAGCEVVVVDLPRSAAAHELTCVDVVVVVVRAGVRATIAAAQLGARLSAHCRDVRLVVRGTGRGALTAAEVAAAVGQPVAAEFQEDRRIAVAADDGQLPRLLARLPFSDLAADVLGARRPAA